MADKEHVSYNAIGLVGTPATLTAAYTGNTYEQHCRYLTNLKLEITYVPKTGQTNRYALVLIEISNDEGTTFIPISVKQDAPAETLMYVEGTDSTSGIPAIIPGDKTSTGGVTYKGYIQRNIVGDKIKISAREDGSADFGTIFIRMTLNSN